MQSAVAAGSWLNVKDGWMDGWMEWMDGWMVSRPIASLGSPGNIAYFGS